MTRAVWIVASREIRTRVRSTAFRVSAIVMLLAVVLVIVIPVRVAQRQHTYTVAIVATLPQPLTNALTAQAAANGLDVQAHFVGTRSAATAQVKAGTATVALVAEATKVEMIWSGDPDTTLAPVISSATSRYVLEQRAAALGLTPTEVTGLLAPARPTVTVLNPSQASASRLVVALAGVILLFVALNIYGSYVLTGVVAEKSTRVVEVLLARVRPVQLLAGKVIGIGLLGVAQFAALAIVAAITLYAVKPPNLPSGTLPQIASDVVWFVLGYSFYSVLYGALGSLASRIEDAQAAAAPLTGLLTLAYLGGFIALQNPHAWWVTALSFFPPTAPMYLPLRSALIHVPLWQGVLAAVLVLAATGAVPRIGGRLYQGAVLHHGTRLRIQQAWRAAP
ncbi:ABC transporter permease [Kribbella sp.]|uniref:ABC transporter permease n=1 Tax=Kribbella sp. TaxID=1871183 RepID=UPI002D2B0D2E|nr:ABC transporter permease [Kribbella sp.]HZX06115.1 ABC transporter permease [Kribbella sp.]